jgi:hypothetical protein
MNWLAADLRSLSIDVRGRRSCEVKKFEFSAQDTFVAKAAPQSKGEIHHASTNGI